MGFLQTLRNLFSSPAEQSQETNRNKSFDEWRAHSLEIGEAIAKEMRPFYKKAASATLSLCRGIPKELKTEIISAPISFSREMDPELIKKLSLTDFKWKEWEFWAPICIENNIFTNWMYHECFPLPDLLDLDFERKKYSPDKVFNLMTLAIAKQRLSAFSLNPKISRAEVIDLATHNPEIWRALIDPHIQKKWDSKKHYEGPTQQTIATLLLRTITIRGQAGMNKNRLERLDGCYEIDFLHEEDKLLYDLAVSLGKLFKNPCSQAELNKIVPFGFSLQRQKMVFFCH